MSSKHDFKSALAKIEEVLRDCFVEGRDDAEKALVVLRGYVGAVKQKNQELVDQAAAGWKAAETAKAKLAKLEGQIAKKLQEADQAKAAHARATSDLQAAVARAEEILDAQIDRKPVNFGLLQHSPTLTPAEVETNRQKLLAVLKASSPAILEIPDRKRKLLLVTGSDFAEGYDQDSLLLFGMILKYITMRGMFVLMRPDPESFTRHRWREVLLEAPTYLVRESRANAWKAEQARAPSPFLMDRMETATQNEGDDDDES